MKRSLGLTIILLTLNFIMMGKTKELNGFELTKESETINVSAEKLWQIAGKQFEDAYLWATTVDHSEGAGAAKFEGASCDTRACELSASGFDRIEEKVTKYSDEKMNFAYQVTSGMPKFVSSASNDWTVVSIGPNKSKLVMKADFRVKGLMGSLMKGMMKKKMSKLLKVVLNDIKVYAETGRPSESKQKRINKIANKKVAA